MKKVLGLLLVGFFVVSCAPKQEISNYAKGIEATRNQQYEQAIEFFNNAVNEENDYEMKASALYNIGFCYGIMKDFEKEVQYFQEALDFFPSFQPALYDLGKYYYDNKDMEKALEMYEQLTEVNPEHEGAYYMLALIQDALGNQDEAMINMKKAAQLNNQQAKEFLAEQGISDTQEEQVEK